MSVANELRAEIATALLVNGKGDAKELLSIVEACDLALRELSDDDDWLPREQPGDLDTERLKPCH